MTKSSPKRARRLIAGILFVVTLLIYLVTIAFDFTSFDDPDYVTENPMVQGGLTWEGVKWAFSNTSAAMWLPLTWISHMADWQLFGGWSGGHHLGNVLLHSINVVVLFLGMTRLTGALLPSAFVAALFAWHPLRVESVAWVAERKDVLSAFFWFVTIGAYARYVESPGRGRYALLAFCFVLGLMSKPMLVTLPFALLLLDVWPLRRAQWPAFGVRGQAIEISGHTRAHCSWPFLIKEKIPLFALTLAAVVVTYLASNGGNQGGSLSLFVRVNNAVVSYARYLGKMVWPTDLAVLYPHPGNWPAWQVLLALAVLVGLSTLAFANRHRMPYLLVGWCWFLGTLVPVIGVVQAGPQAMADRFSYVPMVGILAAGVWWAVEHSGHFPFGKWGLAGVGGVVLCLLMGMTVMQLMHWRNSITLFAHTVSITRNNAIAHYNLAQALSVAGDVRQAVPHYEAAVRIAPDYDAAQNNLGLSYAVLGDPQKAIVHYEAALRSNPSNHGAHLNYGLARASMGDLESAIVHYTKAITIAPGNVWAHYWRGVALARQQKFEEAIACFRQVIALKRDYADAHFELANAAQRMGDVSLAVAHFTKAIELNPSLADAHAALARTLAPSNPEQAKSHFRRTLELNPGEPKVMGELAWLLSTSTQPESRNGEDAVRLGEEACRWTGFRDPELLLILAAAYAEAGRFDDAVDHARKAADISSTAKQAELADRSQRLARQFASRQPYRDQQH